MSLNGRLSSLPSRHAGDLTTSVLPHGLPGPPNYPLLASAPLYHAFSVWQQVARPLLFPKSMSWSTIMTVPP